ncbi:hypothetical protein JOD43_002791 [Pullulanibacillus pueri]|nr:hypothetical protein [Pullulanibacillus pueri]
MPERQAVLREAVDVQVKLSQLGRLLENKT